jgi:hypothetical protein
MMLSSAHVGAAVAAACLTCALLFASTDLPARAVAPLAPAAHVESDGPLPGHTGGFAEPTCHACHFQADVNTGDGSVTLDGIPSEYVGGTTYDITITLAQEGLAAGGFQLSSRFDNGAQAGAIAPSPRDSGRLAVTADSGVHYIHHVYAGTRRTAPDTARWQIQWTAPEASGVIMFHIAANAADDDGSPLGDMIYTTSLSTVPGK